MMNLQYFAVISDSQIVGCTPLNICSQITWYYTSYAKGLSHTLSAVCHITGRRRKGKGVNVPCKRNYYFRHTKDPALV